jgi:hypothetical protein
VPVVWLIVYRSAGINLADLVAQLSVDEQAVRGALAALDEEGRVQRHGEGDDACYRATTFLVPVDAEHGWEAAVFDQFQTMVRAIGTKHQLGAARSAQDDVVGGATITFDISEKHPHKEKVLGLLKRVRSDVNQLWDDVQAYNEAHSIPDEQRTEVSFYFGQCVTLPDEDR